VSPTSRTLDTELVGLFDRSLDLFCIAGFDGYFKRVNRAFERALGYTREQLLTRPFLDLVHPEDLQSSRDALTELAEGRNIVNFRSRVFRADGSVVWLEWNTSTRPDEGVVYGVARDVTERVASEAELNALRRVATLAAQGAPPEEVFEVVAEEVARVLQVPVVDIVRCDGSATGPGRQDAVAAPIVVAGRRWGELVVSTPDAAPPPKDVEPRLAGFTELLATAIANAESREALGRLAGEQAALRRVATLVAEGVRPDQIFAAVSEEVDRLFGLDEATVGRFDLDGPAFVVVGVAKGVDGIPLGSRWELDDVWVSSKVFRTGRSARVDAGDLAAVGGPTAAWARSQGFISQVGSPIIVEGRLWGAITVVTRDEALPLDTDERLEKFAELVATAIANAESRSQLAASRRRVVVAADEARRRIERDLHDGTQQRLVSLGLSLRAAEAEVPPDRVDLRDDLSRIATGLAGAVVELQEISRGIHPAILTEGGLGPALRVLARRSAIPVELELGSGLEAEARLPEPIEVAAYFVASEALANAAKHAQASHIEVSLAMRQDTLVLSICDDGVGGADLGGGSGLTGLVDRVEALDGSIQVSSRAGEGTRVTAELPVERELARDAA
jgi:PAS domain S-box-containing protein